MTITQTQQVAREMYYWASQDRWLHRCTDCWRTKLVYDGELWYATDNGFAVATQPYPHHDRCIQRGKF